VEPHSWAEQTIAPAAINGQTLHPWDTGIAVAELQELLVAHGFSKVRIDGNFGYLTEAAVKAFQRQHELRIDGCVGLKTWAALKTAIQPGTRRLRQGHTGADVAELQGLLRINGYTVDRNGIFCPTTQNCVHHFQQEHKLRDDGVVDAVTWSILRGRPLTKTSRKQNHWFFFFGIWWFMD
jgi:peptidoglycan hydrolase-like protein with peptidoglycan-binding domain